MLDRAKSDYEKLKKTVDELRASEVSFIYLFWHKFVSTKHSTMVQVDADYKLKDMKKLYRDLEMKGKGYKKRLDDLQIVLAKHMEQYGLTCRTSCKIKMFTVKHV